NNIAVGIRYLTSWLSGNGAAAIFNLMEDAATAEIARSQVWQWIRHGVKLDDGREVTEELARSIMAEEIEKLRQEIDGDAALSQRVDTAAELFAEVALTDELVEFLTLPASRHLE